MLDTTEHRLPFVAQSLSVMAQAVSRQFLTAEVRDHFVGFVVDSVALGRICLPVLRFYPAIIIAGMLRIHLFTNYQRHTNSTVHSDATQLQIRHGNWVYCVIRRYR